MATEGDGARQSRERMQRGIAELARRLMPAAIERRDREQAAIDKAVRDDPFGYVWWHHRGPDIRRRRL